jgi:hypothetical protein
MASSTALFTERKIVKLKEDLKDFIVCTVTINGSRVDNEMFLTSVKGEGASNVQIDRTFSGDLVLTAFGEKLTGMTIGGVYIASQCPGTGGKIDLMAFYKKYRAGTNAKTPEIVVTYDKNIFRGVLLGMSLSPYDGQNFNGYNYSFTVFGSFT